MMSVHFPGVVQAFQ